MIIQEQGDQLLVIRQADHAMLAGFFAREWGNEEFSRPEPFESFRLAVAEHDNGWAEWDLHPLIDSATFSPYTFMSIPTEEHILLYQRGIDRLIKVDHYAGLLATIHTSGLYDRARATMPGYSAKYTKSTETYLVNDFVQRLRLQQLRLKVDLRANLATKPFVEEKLLQANAQRFEALDRLSLFFCLASLGDSVIDAVPMDDRGTEVDWELRRLENNVITLEPYPFRREPLEVSVLARRVPKKMYVDHLDFQKTLAQARYFALHFELRPAGEKSFLRAAARA